MSLILDALKRAERERALGAPQAEPTAAPTPLSPPEPPAHRSLVVGLYVLGSVLVVAVAVIVWLVMQPRTPAAPVASAPASSSNAAVPAAPSADRSAAADGSSGEAAAAKTDASSTDGVAGRSTDSSAGSLAGNPVDSPVDGAAAADQAGAALALHQDDNTVIADDKVNSLDDLTGPEAPAELPAGGLKPRSAPGIATANGVTSTVPGSVPGSVPALPRRLAGSPLPAQTFPQPAPKAVITRSPSGVTYIHPAGAPPISAQTLAAEGGGPAGAAPATAAPRAAAPPLGDLDSAALQAMPEDYRAQFPTIGMDVHVYDDDPARRFVLVAGRRYREGDTLASGPKLLRIIPQGVVLEWQGRRVMMETQR